ncbi:hypothetical protein BH10PSE4_BH10PSE4_46700 [soil metagenome]
MADDSEPKLEGLQSQHVFIDTQAYRQRGHNLTVEPFLALGERIAEKDLVLHVADITLREIERQIGEMAVESATTFKQASRLLESWRHRTAGATLPKFSPPAADDLGRAAWRAFRGRALDDWQAVVHDALKMPAALVFDRYFDRQAPFDKDSKEFPDAFVLAALEAWCAKAGEKMYVVSADAAFLRAAEASDHLLPLRRLEDLLAIVTEAQSPEAAQLAQSLLTSEHVRSALAKTVETQIDRLGLYYSGDRYAEGQAVGAQVLKDPEIAKFTVLSRQGSVLKLLIEFDVTLVVELVYEDRSDAFYDREEDAWFGAETAETQVVNDVKVKLLVDVDAVSGEGTAELVADTVTVAETYDTSA